MEALKEITRLNEVAEITLVYRPKIKSSQRPKVSCSRQVYEVLLKFWNPDSLEYTEHFQVIKPKSFLFTDKNTAFVNLEKLVEKHIKVKSSFE